MWLANRAVDAVAKALRHSEHVLPLIASRRWPAIAAEALFTLHAAKKRRHVRRLHGQQKTPSKQRATGAWVEGARSRARMRTGLLR